MEVKDEEEIEHLQRKKRMLSFDNQSQQNSLDELDEAYCKLQQDIDHHLERISFLLRRREEKQRIENEYSSIMMQEIGKYESYLKESQTYIRESSSEGKEVQQLQDHVNIIQSEVISTENAIKEEQKRHESLQREIESLTESIVHKQRIQQEYQKSQQQREQKEKQIRSKIEYHHTSMFSKEHEKTELHNTIQLLHQELNQLANETNQQIQRRDSIYKRMKLK